MQNWWACCVPSEYAMEDDDANLVYLLHARDYVMEDGDAKLVYLDDKA